MSRAKILIVLVFIFCLHCVVMAQSGGSKVGIGFNVGGQRIYSDQPEELFGIGGEGVISYRLAPFADIAFALGYGQLKYNFVPGTGTTTTDMINADIKGNLDIVSKGVFRPFVTVGLGLANYTVRGAGSGRVNDGVFFGGGGFKFVVNPMIDLYAGADYRFTTGDTFDGLSRGQAKDGYLNLRTGMTYFLGGGRQEEPGIIADQRAPFVELEDDPYYTDTYSDPYQSSDPTLDSAPATDSEPKNMEEYVKLKSRADLLLENADSKDQEIAKLQQQLRARRNKLESLEGNASAQPSKKIQTQSSMSGFADIYQEALANFYNKNYSEAVSLFKLLLQQFPNHSLSGNCQFWIGQSYMAMAKYQEAIDEFYKVLSFERSLKKDDSLFFLGKAYLELGSADRARESFTRLVRDYPNSEFVSEARGYVARL